jgi:adenylate cyclase
MSSKGFIITCLMLFVLGVYLFASAPPPLLEERPAGARVAIEQVFAIVEAENDVVRTLWTQEIVGFGKKVGLKFNEDWREPDVDAGPLPALFLRETAMSLEKQPVRLSLFLGSEYPINDANRFQGMQMEKFQIMKQSREPQFFYSSDLGLFTAMFTDEATVEACIGCHNEHKQSPKNDWKLHDVMGATTWMYPSGEVAVEEMFLVLTSLRQGFRDAYTAYLNKVETFPNRPSIGEKWPREGYFLPAVDVFMAEIARQASAQTLASMAISVQPPTSERVIPGTASGAKTEASLSSFTPPVSASNVAPVRPRE